MPLLIPSIINEISIQEQRILITKDSDFIQSFLLEKKPYKLLVISTGNIKNNDLITLISENFNLIEESLQLNQYIELSREQIIIHQ